MFLSYFRAALRLFPGCCFDYIMIFAKRKECFFVILHLCTISTKQCWFIRVFIAQKRHLYSKTQQKATRGRSMKARPTQSRKGVKGQLPLAGSRDSVPCGVWGNAPTVPRATSILNALNKGAGSEASLPVTLRVRRRAPQAALPPRFREEPQKSRANCSPSGLIRPANLCRFGLIYVKTSGCHHYGFPPKVAAPKVSKGRSQTSSVLTALWSLPQERNPLQESSLPQGGPLTQTNIPQSPSRY